MDWVIELNCIRLQDWVIELNWIGLMEWMAELNWIRLEDLTGLDYRIEWN